MKGSVFISGSIAYDFIMNYEGTFKDAILKKDLEHLNVSFTGKNKKMHFGGCGANIAYSLSLFGFKPVLFGVAGKDFEEYSKWLKECGVNVEKVGIDNKTYTASATILTDKKENQLTIFSPGAMESFKAEKKITKKDLKGIGIAILSPDICKRTLRLAQMLKNERVPYFFDPGQMTPAFEIADLKFLLNNAYGFIANSYEVKLLCSRLKILKSDIEKNVKIFIETLGEKGAVLNFEGKHFNIPAVKPLKNIDPTGCGDAYRGGLLAGLKLGLDVIDACRMGALIATYKIENSGTQNHKFTLNEFKARFKKEFRKELLI